MTSAPAVPVWNLFSNSNCLQIFLTDFLWKSYHALLQPVEGHMV